MIQRLSSFTANQRIPSAVKRNPLPAQNSASPRFGVDPNLIMDIAAGGSVLAGLCSILSAVLFLSSKTQVLNIAGADKSESEIVDDLIRLVDDPPKFNGPFKNGARYDIFRWAGPFIESDSEFQRLQDAVSKYHPKGFDELVKDVKKQRLYAKFEREHASELE